MGKTLQQKCVLVDKFAIFIQILLGACAFSTLIYKRHRERPQRPLRIWFYDVSKQMLGAGMVHGLNIIVSYISGSSEDDYTNPCVWYFLNILVDCTVGVFILYVFLKAVQYIASTLGIEGVKSGEYGDPPRFEWWARQTVEFIISILLMKIVIVITFRHFPFLFDFGEWFLGWTLYDARLQVVFVMLVFPLVMNTVQFWLVDQVIKKKLEGVKLEDSRDEEHVFLPVDASDDEMEYHESIQSYLKNGSTISISSITSASAALLRKSLSNTFTDKNKLENKDTEDETYVELRAASPYHL
ncbi:vacuolar membrane protein [Gigaspora margarita]|uniref:Vacuolar membrane protein n=1 Tax=Gigaspora margarita TaxID=4874 RepID=A0A8H3X8U4_GIGMA|nr:vacuolar membrane protein [Gigaspora margarita]